ncbi:hypothetical protein MLD38_031482 [Melastoma candidum]|uniref:Uncharacterized protein n=1 Tax=Melastoma candidum TaxID=119954 RepID=A0ACB9MR29_9MYRT|nr:hypothetical protein MLD38_031482 [Melastoma candidum]
MARHVRLRDFGGGDLSFSTSSPFARLLDACGLSRSAVDTRRVHARILKSGFSSEVFIQNRLIDVYAKCGCLDDARKVFDCMSERNVFTWNAVISAFARFGILHEAERLFSLVPEPDQCSWNAVLSAFSQNERFEEALDWFGRMHKDNCILNEFSFGSTLSACAGLKDVVMGEKLHALVLKSGHSADVYMGSVLVDMYSKCGVVGCAQTAFDEMSLRNLVSWNSLLSCFEQNGPACKALDVFTMMMDHGFEPDEVTLASVVSACATLMAIEEGKQIHARVIKSDEFRDDIVLGNALVDLYAKCSKISEARQVFDRLQYRSIVSATSMVSGYAKAASLKAARMMFTRMMERNIVSWNALIAGYTQNNQNEEAFGLFLQLKREAIEPTHYTFGNLLNACADIANLQLGQQAHAHVVKHGFRFQSEESDIFVGNSLIDMYTKCGSVEEGSRVFANMVDRNKVSWNSMIVGYAQNGYAKEALALFEEMLANGEMPDRVTMIGVLSACSHVGLVEDGRHYFEAMVKDYGLVPGKDHYTCMVDLLGRAGCLDEAKDLILRMHTQADAVIWLSLLGACKVHRDIVLGKFVAEKLLEIDPSNSAPYVLLSNMYAEQKRWADVVRIRKLMREGGIVKQPGCSWIELLGEVHAFIAKDKKHHQKDVIYAMLRMLLKQMKQAGYVPVMDFLEANDNDEPNDSELSPVYGIKLSMEAAV